LAITCQDAVAVSDHLGRAIMAFFGIPSMAAFCVFICIATITPTAAQPDPVDRGRYLVETAAFCGVCHNTRNANGQMIPGMELAGGRVLSISNVPPGDIRAVASTLLPIQRLASVVGQTPRSLLRSAKGDDQTARSSVHRCRSRFIVAYRITI
jgi:hypothetical protein